MDSVRRNQRLRLRPRLGLGPREPVDRQRDAPRHAPVPPERHDHRLLRHLLRPPQRLQLLHQPPRGPLGRAVHQRGQPQLRLEPRVGRAHRPLPRRLDARDGDSVQDPALPRRAAPPLGHPDPALHPAQERVGLPDPHPRLGRRRQRPDRHLPGLGRGHPRGPRAPAGEPQPRGQALRHRGHHHRPHRRPGVEQRGGRQRGHRRQVRHHAEPDRRLHLEHRLRAGRGGRAPGQPDPLPAVLPREARVLPGGTGHLRLRTGRPHRPAGGTRGRGGGRHLRRRQRAAALLQPEDRARAGPRGPHRGGRAGDRQGRAVRRRGAEHPRRRRGGLGQRADQLHGGAAAPRRPPAQLHRRHVHQPVGVAGGPRRGEPGLGGRRHLRVLRERQLRQLLRADPGAGPRVRGQGQRATRASSSTRPTATASRSTTSWSRTTSCPRSASCGATTSGAPT